MCLSRTKNGEASTLGQHTSPLAASFGTGSDFMYGLIVFSLYDCIQTDMTNMWGRCLTPFSFHKTVYTDFDEFFDNISRKLVIFLQ